jgi:hypothetical protein
MTDVFSKFNRRCLGFNRWIEGAEFVYHKEGIKTTYRNFAVMEYIANGTLFKFVTDRCLNGRLPESIAHRFLCDIT